MTWTDPVLGLGLVLFALAAWLPPRRWQGPAMSALGLGLLLWCDPASALLLAALGGGTALLCRVPRPGAARLTAVLLLTLGTLAAFKWGSTAGARDLGAAVPLGLSFYALRLVHVAWERHRGALASLPAGAFVRYLFFFPTLSAGPIHRFENFARDDRRRRWDAANAARGLERILHGFVKIVVLGNFLVSFKLEGFLHTAAALPPPIAALLGCLAYGLNLYFQFSGYSDVAVGLALWAGYRVEENFRWPFLARDLADFWRRWHITLSEWCRDYIFSPVSAGTRNAYAGVLASMLVLGLWHEVSARYALWGLYHGLGIALCQAWKRYGPPPPAGGLAASLRGAAAWILTQGFVVAGFAFTRSESAGAAFATLGRIFGWGGS